MSTKVYLCKVIIVIDDNNTRQVAQCDATWWLEYNGKKYYSGSTIDINDTDDKNIEFNNINGYWDDRSIIADDVRFNIDNPYTNKANKEIIAGHYNLAPIFRINNKTENKMNNINNTNKNTFNSYTYYNKQSNSNETVTFSVSQSDVHIDDSWKISDTETMKEILLYIRSLYTLSLHTDIYKDWVINVCSINDMIEEWCAHNMLYECFLFESHTKDVDITENSWIVKLWYKVLSKIYKLIY